MVKKFWPYRILTRDTHGLTMDMQKIMRYFEKKEMTFDTVVFIPNAGIYLSNIFIGLFGDSYDIEFITVRRASSSAKDHPIKDFVFRRKWASNFMRHVEVFLRLLKRKLKLTHKRDSQQSIDFDVKGKNILVIDDSADTGMTLKIVKFKLLENGAETVSTACISNHLVPDEVELDFSVYRYALLRTQNSRDYYAV